MDQRTAGKSVAGLPGRVGRWSGENLGDDGSRKQNLVRELVKEVEVPCLGQGDHGRGVDNPGLTQARLPPAARRRRTGRERLRSALARRETRLSTKPAISAARPWETSLSSYHLAAAASFISRANPCGSWWREARAPSGTSIVIRTMSRSLLTPMIHDAISLNPAAAPAPDRANWRGGPGCCSR